jgi:hypothetical protein
MKLIRNVNKDERKGGKTYPNLTSDQIMKVGKRNKKTAKVKEVTERERENYCVVLHKSPKLIMREGGTIIRQEQQKKSGK